VLSCLLTVSPAASPALMRPAFMGQSGRSQYGFLSDVGSQSAVSYALHNGSSMWGDSGSESFLRTPTHRPIPLIGSHASGTLLSAVPQLT